MAGWMITAKRGEVSSSESGQLGLRSTEDRTEGRSSNRQVSINDRKNWTVGDQVEKVECS